MTVTASAIPAQTLTKLLSGSVASTADFSAQYKAVWDNTGLYLLVTVNDDIRQNNSGTATWDDDAIEIFVDGGTADASLVWQAAFTSRR